MCQGLTHCRAFGVAQIVNGGKAEGFLTCFPLPRLWTCPTLPWAVRSAGGNERCYAMEQALYLILPSMHAHCTQTDINGREMQDNDTSMLSPHCQCEAIIQTDHNNHTHPFIPIMRKCAAPFLFPNRKRFSKRRMRQ